MKYFLVIILDKYITKKRNSIGSIVGMYSSNILLNVLFSFGCFLRNVICFWRSVHVVDLDKYFDPRYTGTRHTAIVPIKSCIVGYLFVLTSVTTARIDNICILLYEYIWIQVSVSLLPLTARALLLLSYVCNNGSFSKKLKQNWMMNT